ncbi:MAG: putative photosynthetic complex assembly protein PuhE [Pseudomonadota bacterium]
MSDPATITAIGASALADPWLSSPWFASSWAAVAAAVALWWFSTGVILVAVKSADHAGAGAHLGAAVVGAPFLALGWFLFMETLHGGGVVAVYGAFVAALLIWGWFELAFLCGVVTGPNSRPCPPDAPHWERFLRGWGAIAYSEMALAATLFAIGALSVGAANQVAAWTFGLLFTARISAKLNLYLGVPGVNEEFLPNPMRHLPSHFREAPMNPLFPLSVTALAAGTAWWIGLAAAQPAGAPLGVAYTLLAALTALALLEHGFMVARGADARLWRWLLPQDTPLETGQTAPVAAAQPAGADHAFYGSKDDPAHGARVARPARADAPTEIGEKIHGL